MEQNNEHIKNRPGLPKVDSGFGVPEGYFETFGERLQLRLDAEKHVSKPKGVLYYLKPALGYAAGLAILLTVYLYPPGKQRTASIAKMQVTTVVPSDDQIDPLSSTYASLISDPQFFTALTEMDEYDASQMPKEALVDYLASNCSEFEILNTNK